MTVQDNQIEIRVRNEINASDYLIDKIAKYANEQAKKDRFDDNGNAIYEIVEIQLLLCDKAHPIGRYERRVVKIWIRDTSKKFYSLLNKRDNYQHSERYGHWVKDENEKKFRFDLDFKEF